MNKRVKSRTDEIRMPWQKKKEHPTRKRVGDAPRATGIDYAMSLVGQAAGPQKRLDKASEEEIMQYPKTAYYYAARVMRDRWREAENVIRQDPKWWKKYKQFVKSLPDDKQRYVNESFAKKITLNEALRVKEKLVDEIKPLYQELLAIQTKLKSETVERRMRVLGGEKQSEYKELCGSVESSVSKLKQIITELMSETGRT